MQEAIDQPQFFVLPARFFSDLREEILKNSHDKQMAARIMYGLGRSTAVNIFNSHGLGDSQDEIFENVMHLHWAEVGLGMMSIWTREDDTFIIHNRRSTEAQTIGFTGEPSCFFSAGYLAGLAHAWTKLPYVCTEQECISQGHDKCTFILTKQ